jgi:hypothetical protein
MEVNILQAKQREAEMRNVRSGQALASVTEEDAGHLKVAPPGTRPSPPPPPSLHSSPLLIRFYERDMIGTPPPLSP